MPLYNHQDMKQPAPNDVTDEGIEMEVSPLQPLKQWLPNDVTDEGIEMEIRPQQSSKQ